MTICVLFFYEYLFDKNDLPLSDSETKNKLPKFILSKQTSNMKKIITAFIFFAYGMVFGQSFEGKITYDRSFTSIHPEKASSQEVTNLIGWKQEIYVKNGSYKSVVNGSYCQWQLYVPSENRIYTKVKDSDTLLWSDASVPSEKIIAKTKIKKNDTKILGYPCDAMAFALYSGGSQFYTFAPKLAVDVKLYEQHKFGLWLDFLNEAKAWPLKTKIETTQFVMETIATEVTPMKLEDAFFALPADVKVKKNPRNSTGIRGTWFFAEID